MSFDFNKYIGIPWKCGCATMEGADCFGIVIMIMQEAFGMELEHYDPTTIDNPQKATQAVTHGMAVNMDTGKWLQVDEPKELDVVFMIGRVSGRPEHVGVYLARGRVLHSLQRDTGISEIHFLKFIKPLFKRLEYYRYVG